MRRKQSSAVFPIIALVMIAIFLCLVYLSFAGPEPTVRIASTAIEKPTPTPTPLTFDAEQVVRQMYDAMTDKDDVAYLRALSVESRSKIRVERVLSGFIDQSRIDLYGLYISLDHLDDISFLDMTYSGIWQRDGYVLVYARGQAYLKAFRNMYPACEIWDVYRSAEGWHVDRDAPERDARVQKLDEKRVKDAGFDGLPLWMAMPLLRMNVSAEDNIRMFLNTCE